MTNDLDLSPIELGSDNDEPTLIEEKLDIVSWSRYPANAFGHKLVPEMLTHGVKVLGTLESNRASLPKHLRKKYIFLFDRSFVVAYLARAFKALQCDAIQFIELCCDACGIADDDAIRHYACDDVALSENIDSILESNPVELISDTDLIGKVIDENSKLKIIVEDFTSTLREFRANAPKPDRKGNYLPRYDKAMKLLERLENTLKYDFSGNIDKLSQVDIEEVKKKLVRC